MNFPVPTGAAGFLARYDAVRARLPGDVAVRDAAAASFRAGGFPTMRDEAWKFTNLRVLADLSFGQSDRSDHAALLARLPAIDAPRLVFVDGVFQPECSSVPAGVVMGRFADAPAFGPLARPDREPMVALNTMMATDGISLHVPANVDAGVIVLAHIGTDKPSHPRHRIELATAARLTLLDVSLGAGTYFHNPVLEITLADDAALTHVRWQDEAPSAFHLATIYADIAARGTYDSFTLTLGARLARAEMHVRLGGAGGITHLNAAQILTGHQHADFTTIVSHEAPHCASRQTVKNVLAGRSRGVFQGKIHVARGAQKTDGYQMNQALLLSPDAEIDSKPQLEIYADDVKCSHGATVGELDADQFFYLRSRGIPEAQAREMLVHAFLTEALDTVSNEPIRAVLEHAVAGWWERNPL